MPHCLRFQWNILNELIQLITNINLSPRLIVDVFSAQNLARIKLRRPDVQFFVGFCECDWAKKFDGKILFIQKYGSTLQNQHVDFLNLDRNKSIVCVYIFSAIF